MAVGLPMTEADAGRACPRGHSVTAGRRPLFTERSPAPAASSRAGPVIQPASSLRN
jgi:hypothetical protein